MFGKAVLLVLAFAFCDAKDLAPGLGLGEEILPEAETGFQRDLKNRVGACCWEYSGQCYVRSPYICKKYGGKYIGHGTTCSTDVCPATSRPTPTPTHKPTKPSKKEGACCWKYSGQCYIRSKYICKKYGGEYFGHGSECNEDICPATGRPTPKPTATPKPTRVKGACCLPYGECKEIPEKRCNRKEGDYLGDEESCEPGICLAPTPMPTTPMPTPMPTTPMPTPMPTTPMPTPMPKGACCSWKGDCLPDTTEEKCRLLGKYQGDDSSCQDPDVRCRRLRNLGACCVGDQCLSPVPKFLCDKLQGDWAGEGVRCRPKTCPLRAPTGACCLWSGGCEAGKTERWCEQNGRYQGNGSNCDLRKCPFYRRGACCFKSWCRDEAVEPECFFRGGDGFAAGVKCEPDTCPLAVPTPMPTTPMPTPMPTFPP